MKIDQLPQALDLLVQSIQSATNRNIAYRITEAVEADKFPDQVDNIIGKDRDGIYCFYSPIDNKIHYVGISNDVVSRFYKHIGSNFSWTRNGNVAKFPNCALTRRRHWLEKEVHDLFENAKFKVKFVIPEEKEAKEVIESFLIYYSWAMGEKFSVNVMK
jgi:hypothetical protein